MSILFWIEEPSGSNKAALVRISFKFIGRDTATVA